MRKLLLSVLFLVLSNPAWATIAYVNSSVFQGSGSAQTSLATAALNVTTGNLIVVTVSINSSGTVSSISDTAGNTYHQATGCYETYSSSNASDIWYAYNVTGNANNVVTVVVSANVNYNAVSQIQYSGALATSAVFQTCGIGETFGSSLTSSSFNPSVANGVNVMNEYSAGAGTVSPGANYTERAGGWATADYIGAPSGAQTASFTNTSSIPLILSVASFAPAATVSTPVLTATGGLTVKGGLTVQ